MADFNDSNTLEGEKSLYLKQHAHQEIAWKSWSRRALEESKKRNLPIFLSIGYSSCHWCHVMSKESFDSPEVAKVLNEGFISIKVDREEHPQLDQYFQKMALHIMGRGGWPLSFFLTPDLKPIFCGTYFPLEGKGDHPGFIDICKQVLLRFQNNLEEVKQEGEKIISLVIAEPELDPSKKIEFQHHFPSPPSILNALNPYKDTENGGYGEAPKFPSFAFYEWAIEQVLEGVLPQEFAEHIVKSIESMNSGGVFDQVRGGIHRYSTDKRWLVPHFEKMLYDQAGLLKVLSKVSLVYPSPVILDNLFLTLEYLESEMLSEDGYFFSAQDADSEGVEGLYFSFTEEEFEDAVTRFDDTLEQDLESLKKWFGITPLGNFDNHLNVISLNRAHFEDMFLPENWEKIRKAKKALLIERSKRVPPTTDNKGIASWNFLIISALCDVIQYSKVEDFREIATNLLNKSLDGVHKAFLSQKDGETALIKHTTTLEDGPTLLEDYVFFAEAHSRLYELTGKDKFKKNALSSLKYILKTFYNGSYFYTGPLDNKDKEVENIHQALFDQSYRSPAATMIALLKKWGLVDEELAVSDSLKNFLENTKQLALTNPIAFGEAIRGLIYPDAAFKKIEVPKAWVKNSEFLKIRVYFSNRFLIQYIDGNQWQICDFNACEATGNDLESFVNYLKRNSPEEEPK